MSVLRLALAALGLCLSASAFALHCGSAASTPVPAGPAASGPESVVLDCGLDSEKALSVAGELDSTLVRAGGYLEVRFSDARGRVFWRVQRGPWLGRFQGLEVDETISVPAGATRVQLVATTKGGRPDSAGAMRLEKARMSAGVPATLDPLNPTVIDTDSVARWAVQSPMGSTAASVTIELLTLEGELMQRASLSLPVGGGRAEFAWPKLPVGYYDVRAVASADGLQDTSLRSAIAVVLAGEAPRERRFGIDAALSWYGGAPKQVARSLAMMQRAGIGTVRDRLSWSQVQPTPAGVRWGRYAEVADAVNTAGLDAVQVFHDSPAWARAGAKGSADRQPPTDDAAAFAFGRAYAQGLGRTVRNIEYWNEQNSDFFRGYPYQYASGLKAFSSGVKSADPGIRVLIGSAAGKPGRFYQELYANHVANFFDLRNQHYYGKNVDIYGFAREELAQSERKAGIGDRAGWLTEIGYSLRRDENGEWRDAELEQADYLVKAYAAGFAAGYERVFFFFWGELAEAQLHTWGVVRSDFTPRPAYQALAVLARHLAGAELVATERLANGMSVYFRQTGGSYVAVTWGENDIGRLGRGIRVMDIYGREVDVSKVKRIRGQPRLLAGIAKLPSTAQVVPKQSVQVPIPPVLRLSVETSVAGKPLTPAASNSVAVSVGEGESIEVSGRVFVTGPAPNGDAIKVQCVSGAGIEAGSPVLLSVMPSESGAPFECRYRATLTSIGESFVAVYASYAGNSDAAHVALIPDAGRVGTGVMRALERSGKCLRWVPRSSRNVTVTLFPRSSSDKACPAIEVLGQVNSDGETWVFPVAPVQGSDWKDSMGVQVVISQIKGVAQPPRPLLLQLVERSGGIWLVELAPAGNGGKTLSGLFNLARPASWARDNNGHLDLENVHEVMLGWGGYGGHAGQRYGFAIESISLTNGDAMAR